MFVTPDRETVGIASKTCRPLVAKIDTEAALRRRNDLWLSLVESGDWSIGEIAAAHGMPYHSVARVLRSARQVRERLRDALEDLRA